MLNFDNLEIEHYDTKVKDIFLINDHARELKERGERFLTVFLGRGCPYNCFFCYRQLKGYRTFNPDTIDAMFKLIKQKGFGFVQIIDECLTSNKNALRAVCASAKKYDIFWRANARADNMSPEIMRFLSEHNCEGVKIGIESFDPDMLNAMNKKTTPEMNIAAVNRAYQYGVHTGLQLILGTPGENRKTIFNTREGMWQCYFPQEKIACAILNPYPGSDAYFYGLERGYIRDKEYVHEHFEAKSKLVVNFSHISDRELVLWQQWLHCEAAISYRIKQRALLLSKHLTSIFLSFFKRAALLLVHEPVSFLCVVWYLLSGFRYWLKPVKRVVRCKEDNEKSGQLPFLNFW